jgi:hypothetical protein
LTDAQTQPVAQRLGEREGGKVLLKKEKKKKKEGGKVVYRIYIRFTFSVIDVMIEFCYYIYD